MLLGIVAFGIAAAQTASEYSLGTLRQVLVRQPRRIALLAGKMLAVVTFILLAFVFAAVVAFVVAIVMAHARHTSTSAWFTGTGLGDLFRALGDIALAVVGYSILGLAIGQLLRSAVFSVIAGLAWMIAIENIIARIVPGTTKWLPGAALETVASGGTEGPELQPRPGRRRRVPGGCPGRRGRHLQPRRRDRVKSQLSTAPPRLEY